MASSPLSSTLSFEALPGSGSVAASRGMSTFIVVMSGALDCARLGVLGARCFDAAADDAPDASLDAFALDVLGRAAAGRFVAVGRGTPGACFSVTFSSITVSSLDGSARKSGHEKP